MFKTFENNVEFRDIKNYIISNYLSLIEYEDNNNINRYCLIKNNDFEKIYLDYLIKDNIHSNDILFVECLNSEINNILKSKYYQEHKNTENNKYTLIFLRDENLNNSFRTIIEENFIINYNKIYSLFGKRIFYNEDLTESEYVSNLIDLLKLKNYNIITRGTFYVPFKFFDSNINFFLKNIQKHYKKYIDLLKLSCFSFINNYHFNENNKNNYNIEFIETFTANYMINDIDVYLRKIEETHKKIISGNIKITETNIKNEFFRDNIVDTLLGGYEKYIFHLLNVLFEKRNVFYG